MENIHVSGEDLSDILWVDSNNAGLNSKLKTTLTLTLLGGNGMFTYCAYLASLSNDGPGVVVSSVLASTMAALGAYTLTKY